MASGSVSFTNARVIGPALMRQLRSLQFSASGTRRVCLHKDERAPLHVMLVELTPESVYPKHCHTDSDETTIVVSGRLAVTLWSLESPNERETLQLGSGAGQDGTGLFIPRGQFHQTSAMLPGTTYLEIKGGPFDPDALVLADT